MFEVFVDVRTIISYQSVINENDAMPYRLNQTNNDLIFFASNSHCLYGLASKDNLLLSISCK